MVHQHTNVEQTDIIIAVGAFHQPLEVLVQETVNHVPRRPQNKTTFVKIFL
jgi:hypothetical protein